MRLKFCCSFSLDGLMCVSKLPRLGVHPDCVVAPSQGDGFWLSARSLPQDFWAASVAIRLHHPGLEAKHGFP